MKKEKKNKDINCFAEAVKENIGRSGNKSVKSRRPISELWHTEERIYHDYPFKFLGRFSKLLPKIPYLEIKASLEISGYFLFREHTCILTEKNINRLYKKIYAEGNEKYELHCQTNKYIWQ